ncbi:hypothetical protein H7H74_11270 [Mycolicibacterium chitae]|uniref:hypothetical protein n=1 Tax=Mycolicibacterium sp. TaxID=2320850 RepID=UPI003483FDC6|nr:hypothetical protein [Mycolicibacterium chitae]
MDLVSLLVVAGHRFVEFVVLLKRTPRRHSARSTRLAVKYFGFQVVSSELTDL